MDSVSHWYLRCFNSQAEFIALKENALCQRLAKLNFIYHLHNSVHRLHLRAASYRKRASHNLTPNARIIMAGIVDKIGPILFSEADRLICFRFIDTHIVPRRGSIIRHGRQIQDCLRIPTMARVFTETDPGMPDADIQLAAKFIFTASTSFAAGLLFAFARGSFWTVSSLAFAVVIPGCLLTLLWIGMAFSRRRRAREAESVFRMRRGMDYRGRTMWRE